MSNVIKQFYWRMAEAVQQERLRRSTPKEMFSAIYKNKLWGAHDDFSSGSGSHTEGIVGPYVQAVRQFLQGCGPGQTVVDIGCGDFAVGSRIVDAASAYIACDVVPELIDRNRQRFQAPGLRFETVDAVEDPLPAGDVVCIRQVLQHLSNAQIAAVVGKLAPFRHWIITEHLPAQAGFAPNRDKRPGHDIRIVSGHSGIVLTAAPFNVRPSSERVLCEVPESVGDRAGVIRTTLYSF
jgi:hypothetical protein